MNRLLAILFLFGALLLVPALAFAQDDDPTTVLVSEGEELPDATENPADAVSSGDDLNTISSLEYWHLLAVLLPVVIGKIGNWLPRRYQKSDHMAQLSMLVYLVYASMGEALKGSFDSLTWDTPQLVMASAIKTAGIAYAAYKIVGNATPRLVGGVPGPTS